MDNSPIVVDKRSPIMQIVTTGLLAGGLDGLGATVTFLLRGGKNPVTIFNFIASGVFGKEALSGGWNYALLGLIFHLVIATLWTAIYFMAYIRLSFLTRNWWLSGLGYGVFVWLGMSLVVVPLSNTPPLPFTTSRMLVGIAVLMICIGLPISFSASRFYK